MGEPLSLAWEVLVNQLSVVVGLFGAWRVMRKRLMSFLHLVIVHLEKRKKKAGLVLVIWPEGGSIWWPGLGLGGSVGHSLKELHRAVALWPNNRRNGHWGHGIATH